MNCRQFAARGSLSSPTPSASAASLAEIPESQIEPRPREPLECIAPKFAWLPDTLSSIRVFAGKISLDVFGQHGCTSCTTFSKAGYRRFFPNAQQGFPCHSGDLWGLRVFSPDVVQPFAPGLHLFFFRPPRLFPASQDPFPCHCCTKFHGNSHGYCDAHRLARFYHNAFSRCHLVPWIQTDLLSWFAFVMMQHSSFERAENRIYVPYAGPHGLQHACNMVCNMLCNIVEVVTHRPTGSNQPQTNSSDSAGIAL